MLGPKRAAVFKPHYRVKAAGNADLSPRSDPHREFRGLNCLIEVHSQRRSAVSCQRHAIHQRMQTCLRACIMDALLA